MSNPMLRGVIPAPTRGPWLLPVWSVLSVGCALIPISPPTLYVALVLLPYLISFSVGYLLPRRVPPRLLLSERGIEKEFKNHRILLHPWNNEEKFQISPSGKQLELVGPGGVRVAAVSTESLGDSLTVELAALALGRQRADNIHAASRTALANRLLDTITQPQPSVSAQYPQQLQHPDRGDKYFTPRFLYCFLLVSYCFIFSLIINYNTVLERLLFGLALTGGCYGLTWLVRPGRILPRVRWTIAHDRITVTRLGWNSWTVPGHEVAAAVLVPSSAQLRRNRRLVREPGILLVNSQLHPIVELPLGGLNPYLVGQTLQRYGYRWVDARIFDAHAMTNPDQVCAEAPSLTPPDTGRLVITEHGIHWVDDIQGMTTLVESHEISSIEITIRESTPWISITQHNDSGHRMVLDAPLSDLRITRAEIIDAAQLYGYPLINSAPHHTESTTAGIPQAVVDHQENAFSPNKTIVRPTLKMRLIFIALGTIPASVIGAIMVFAGGGRPIQVIPATLCVIILLAIAALGDRSHLTVEPNRLQAFSRRGRKRWEITREQVANTHITATAQGIELVLYGHSGHVIRRDNTISAISEQLADALRHHSWLQGQPSTHQSQPHPPVQI